MPISVTMTYLESIFPGQVVIPVIKAGTCLSWAAQTTRNKLSANNFPIRTFVIGGSRVVRKSDLAEYIDGLASGRSKRGRPKGSTKASRFESHTVSVGNNQ